ncbi:RluA family pseudouridine synthase, partial [Candidatus Kaiserbacteria bacterium]|nr:RluA family pseudouridine synthase [Candidatus Kaiserbacteria bacterium]
MNELTIIYEDDDVLVIDKPAGLIVHSDGRTQEPSVAEWVTAHYPETRGVGEPWLAPQGQMIDRPGIVHRLDRSTSGVMILAKSQEAHAFLKNEFQNRLVLKEYRAYVYGHPKEDKGVVNAEIERVRATPPRWGIIRGGGPDRAGKPGRAAITEWEVFERGVDKETGEKVSLVAARPKTGRTHQIRVHLQAMHHPIICDPLYAKGKVCLLGFTRP